MKRLVWSLVAFILTQNFASSEDKIFDALPDVGPVGASQKLATNLRIDTESRRIVGITTDAQGIVYFSTTDNVYRLKDDEPEVVICPYIKLWNGLISRPDGHILACERLDEEIKRQNREIGGRIVDFSLVPGSTPTPITTRQFNNPLDLIADGHGGLYVTDTDPNSKGTVYYLEKYRDKYTAKGNEWKQRATDLPGARSVRLSPDENTLYVVLSGDKKMLSYPLSGPGQLGEARVFCELAQFPSSKIPGALGATVDAEGNVYYATERGLQAFNSQGKPHGTIKMPDNPTNAILGIDGRKGLYVTTQDGLYRFPMKVDGIKRNF